MIAALLTAAALLLPLPAAQPDVIDLTKVVSVSDYGPNQLLLAMSKDTFLVVKKDAITYAAPTITVPTSAVMMMIVSDAPPIVLKAEWHNAEGIRFEIVINCATYTSFTACLDAFDSAVDAMKKRNKPKPPNWVVEMDKSKFEVTPK